MDRARHKSSPSSERLLGSFLPPSAAGDQPGSVAFELDEDDLFASGAPSPERPQPPRRPLLISSIRAANPSPTIPRLRRPPGGILEALPERFGPLSPPLSSSSTSSSPASPVTALPRMIPSIPRPAPAPAMHMPQSAPVNVPAARLRRPPVVDEFTAEADDDDDEEMLPPHEMVARSRARESPMTTFSVLEGAGRTLKGRDLRQSDPIGWGCGVCSHGEVFIVNTVRSCSHGPMKSSSAHAPAMLHLSEAVLSLDGTGGQRTENALVFA